MTVAPFAGETGVGAAGATVSHRARATRAAGATVAVAPEGVAEVAVELGCVGRRRHGGQQNDAVHCVISRRSLAVVCQAGDFTKPLART